MYWYIYQISQMSVYKIIGPHVYISRYALYDLLIAMLPYMNSDKIRQVFNIATENIQVSGKAEATFSKNFTRSDNKNSVI